MQGVYDVLEPVGLSAPKIDLILSEVEGWAAGTNLPASSFDFAQDEPIGGSNRHALHGLTVQSITRWYG